MQFFAMRMKRGNGWFAIALGFPVAFILDWILIDSFFWQSRAASFPTATAVITHSEIIVRQGSKGGQSFVLKLRYDFSVGDQKFTGERLRYYSDDGNTRSVAERLQSEFPLGRSVTAYYPPDDPSQAILRPGIEGVDCLRGLFAIGLNLLVIGGAALLLGKAFGFDPDDPDCVRQTPTGWEAQMPYTSHGGAFAVSLAGACMLSSFLLLATRGPNPPEQLVGAALAASVALAAVGSIALSRYPTLAADLDAKELVLPAPWLGDPVRVPFDQIGTIAVREEVKTTNHRDTYPIYHCEVGWGTRERFHITKIATFVKRVEAERLVAWLKVTLGRLGDDVDGPGGLFRG